MQQNSDHQNQTVAATLGRGRRPAQTNRSRQQLQREKALQMATKQKEDVGSLPPEQQLTKPPDPPSVSQPAPLKSPEQSKVMESELVKQELVKHESVKHEPEEPEAIAQAQPTVAIKELDKQEVELREKSRLEQFQWEQRIMEEKNKKRKAFLTKTIAEKSKQTQAEAVKLKKIQRELQALDDSVSNDIGILRKLIEESSMDYSSAWKRFEKAEAEYVAAKLDLHKKTEVKEQLTEHLCAIIQQNELRKARKLEELMLQLELNAEEVPNPEETEKENKESTDNLRSISENSLTEGMKSCTEVDGSSLSKDGSITEPKISQDNQEIRATDVSTDGPS